LLSPQDEKKEEIFVVEVTQSGTPYRVPRISKFGESLSALFHEFQSQEINGEAA